MTTFDTGRAPAGPFGVLLAQLLTNRDMRRSDLARRCGIDRTMVTRLIDGEKGPSLLTVQRIADTLDVTDATRLRLFVAASETASARRNGGVA